jgi:hypothetical protein
VKAITEELCGHSFSASSISAMNQRLDDTLAQFAGRPLAEAFPYLILDAREHRPPRLRSGAGDSPVHVPVAPQVLIALTSVGTGKRPTIVADAMQLAKQCEFSGISHKYITIGDSAKVALRRCGTADPRANQFSSGEVLHRPSCRRRSRAPHPSCSWTRRRRGRARRSRYPALGQPCRAVPRLSRPRSDQSAHCCRQTLVSSSKSAC